MNMCNQAEPASEYKSTLPGLFLTYIPRSLTLELASHQRRPDATHTLRWYLNVCTHHKQKVIGSHFVGFIRTEPVFCNIQPSFSCQNLK